MEDYDLNASGSWKSKFLTMRPDKNRRKEEKRIKDGERRRQKEEVGHRCSEEDLGHSCRCSEEDLTLSVVKKR